MPRPVAHNGMQKVHLWFKCRVLPIYPDPGRPPSSPVGVAEGLARRVAHVGVQRVYLILRTRDVGVLRLHLRVHCLRGTGPSEVLGLHFEYIEHCPGTGRSQVQG